MSPQFQRAIDTTLVWTFLVAFLWSYPHGPTALHVVAILSCLWGGWVASVMAHFVLDGGPLEVGKALYDEMGPVRSVIRSWAGSTGNGFFLLFVATAIHLQSPMYYVPAAIYLIPLGIALYSERAFRSRAGIDR